MRCLSTWAIVASGLFLHETRDNCFGSQLLRCSSQDQIDQDPLRHPINIKTRFNL